MDPMGYQPTSNLKMLIEFHPLSSATFSNPKVCYHPVSLPNSGFPLAASAGERERAE
jgi:hypothetical protein